MRTLREAVGKAFGFGVYGVGVVALSALSVWCAVSVGGAAINLIDQLVLDGSGHPDREQRSVALEAAASDEADARAGVRDAAADAAPREMPEKPAAEPTPAVRGQPIVTPDDDPAAAFHRGGSDTYRTYCVRLCDGYFWPVSFSTTPAHFDDDLEVCTSSCNSPAKLFVHRIPGEGPSEMTTPEGLPYTALKTAFRFRASYDAQCKCRAEPWDIQALDRHRLFAAAAAAGKGSKAAAAEARELAAKVDAYRREEAKALDLANERADRELAALSRSAAVQGIAAEAQSRRRRAAEERAARLAEFRQSEEGIMRLGAEPEAVATRNGRWAPASGTGRHWKDTVFSGN